MNGGKYGGAFEKHSTYFYHTDHVGTVSGVSDMSGTVVWEASYTAFGEVINITGLLEQRAVFGGKGYDSDSALYYFNARWYDPENGRFISEDPARDGVNWYAYVGNNPLKWTDPTGMYGFNGGYSGYNYSTGESVDNGWNSTTGSYDDDDDDDDDDESSVGTPGGGTAQPPVQPPADPMDMNEKTTLNDGYLGWPDLTKWTEDEMDKYFEHTKDLVPVFTYRGGTVVFVGWQEDVDGNPTPDAGLGFYMVIDGPSDIKEYIGHNDPIYGREVGSVLKPMDVVAYEANPTNGNSTGPHTHYELRDSEGYVLKIPKKLIDYIELARKITLPQGITTLQGAKYDHKGVDFSEY